MNCDANKLMLHFNADDEIRFNINLSASAATADRRTRPVRPHVGSDSDHASPSAAVCRDIYTDDETSLDLVDTGTRGNSIGPTTNMLMTLICWSHKILTSPSLMSFLIFNSGLNVMV